MRVALCVIATGKYTRFLCGLLGTAYEFFCPGHDVRILVFSDSAVSKHHQNTIVIPTPHEPWPGPTLHRYRTMLQAADGARALGLRLLPRRQQSFCAAGGRGDFRRPGGHDPLRLLRGPAEAVDLRDAVCQPGPRRSRGAQAGTITAAGFRAAARHLLAAMRSMAAAIVADDAAASRPAGTTRATGTVI